MVFFFCNEAPVSLCVCVCVVCVCVCVWRFACLPDRMEDDEKVNNIWEARSRQMFLAFSVSKKVLSTTKQNNENEIPRNALCFLLVCLPLPPRYASGPDRLSHVVSRFVSLFSFCRHLKRAPGQLHTRIKRELTERKLLRNEWKSAIIQSKKKKNACRHQNNSGNVCFLQL